MAIVRDDKLLEYIKTFDIEGYGVAIHGVRNDNGENQIEICNSICQNGLKLGNSYGSINGNAFGMGKAPQDDLKIEETLSNYSWGHPQVNVILSYPPVIENSRGEKLYIVYTPYPKVGYDQNTTCSFMDIACSSLGYIPKEFILGYYIDKDDKYGHIERGEHIDYEFTANEHFNKINDELFDKMKEAMGIYANLSTAYAEGDVDKINNQREMFRRFGLENFIKEALKNADQDVFGSRERKL